MRSVDLHTISYIHTQFIFGSGLSRLPGRPNLTFGRIDVDVNAACRSVEGLGDLPALATCEVVPVEDLLECVVYLDHVLAGVRDGVRSVNSVEACCTLY